MPGRQAHNKDLLLSFSSWIWSIDIFCDGACGSSLSASQHKIGSCSRGGEEQCRAAVVLLCLGSKAEQGYGRQEAPGVMQLPEPCFLGARCIDIEGHGGRTSTQLSMSVVKSLKCSPRSLYVSYL